jgi:hypothetical protein
MLRGPGYHRPAADAVAGEGKRPKAKGKHSAKGKVGCPPNLHAGTGAR